MNRAQPYPQSYHRMQHVRWKFFVSSIFSVSTLVLMLMLMLRSLSKRHVRPPPALLPFTNSSVTTNNSSLIINKSKHTYIDKQNPIFILFLSRAREVNQNHPPSPYPKLKKKQNKKSIPSLYSIPELSASDR